MREIRFRAWDTHLLEWLGAEHWFVDPDEGKVYAWLPDRKEYLRLDYVVPLQYTGLKDKNGVEIYEGDIVTQLWYSNDVKEYRQSEVDFNNFIWQLEEFGKPDDIEVIGNIYENPELLK